MTESHTATGRIKIIGVPAGEAPLNIRKCWQGVVLPCEPIHDDYFRVPQGPAIDALSSMDASAALWFRQHGYPKTKPGEDYFGFEAAVVEIISGVHRKSHVWYNDLEQEWEGADDPR